MEEANLTRSMSKKGCSPDNSACEGFFGHLKTEMFYGHNWDEYSIEEFIQEIMAICVGIVKIELNQHSEDLVL